VGVSDACQERRPATGLRLALGESVASATRRSSGPQATIHVRATLIGKPSRGIHGGLLGSTGHQSGEASEPQFSGETIEFVFTAASRTGRSIPARAALRCLAGDRLRGRAQVAARLGAR
jgi:hypothetical protein